MTVKQLKELLATLPDGMEVIIEKTGGGQGFSPLASGSDKYVYEAENTYSGNAIYTEHTADDMCMEEQEWKDLKASLPQVLVLSPTS